MTDAVNHLAAFNRIALALESLPPDDLTALITAINAIANKTIPVADMTGVATAIANKTIPVTDMTAIGTKLDTLNTTISNLSLGGGSSGGGTGGALDCSCLADAIKPLIQKIDDLVCVIVPIANSQHQIQKIIGYIGLDGPNMGIDAPPGTFVFPTPGDSSPPLPYTPWPGSDVPLDPDTGAWITPPVIDGEYYIEPPGGMAGGTDLAAYKDYKCDMATYIMRYTRAWFEAIAQVPMVVGAVDFIYGAIEALVAATQFALGSPSGPRPYYSAAAGAVKLVKAGTTKGPVILSGTALILLSLVLVDMVALMATISVLTSQYLAMFNARKYELICALYKAKTVGEARTKFMAILGRNPVQISFWYDKIARYVLSDTFLAHLFAVSPDFDPASIAGLGLLEGGCAQCVLCSDMDVTLNVNKKSIYGYPAPTDETRTGYENYPLTIDLGTIDSDALCMVGRAVWINGGGTVVHIWQNGADLGAWSWAGFTDTGAGNNSTLESMPFKENIFYPKLPATRFAGHIVVKVYNEGETWKTEYEVQSVGYKEAAPAP